MRQRTTNEELKFFETLCKNGVDVEQKILRILIQDLAT